MTWSARIPGGLQVLGRGEADGLRRELFDPRALTRVRFADPAAWATATAIARALAEAWDSVEAAGDSVGVLVGSARGPAQTMANLAVAAREGYSSPLRYPASNPGSLAGVACLAFGLRGPSLVLTMPAAQDARVGLSLAGQWLGRGVVPLVALAIHASRPPGRDLARCLILARRPDVGAEPADDPEAAAQVAWLAAVEDALDDRE